MAKVGIIGGSGLGEALCGETTGELIDVNTPFGEPSCKIIQTQWHGTDVAILNRHGDGHLIPPSKVNYRANIYALKSLGCTHVIASGAVGSLREELQPKHLVIADQIIDKTTRRIGTFFDDLACHVEFAQPFCPILRQHLLNCASAVKTKVHDGGTYVCMEGPAFSTRAESEMHRIWGGDLIGMTVMPEAKLAREAEMAYALVALPSDYDCWRPVPADLDKHELLKEIIGNLTEATANAIELIKEAVAKFDAIADIPSAAHSALELGIWSNKTLVDDLVKENLSILVAKYF
ncbi:MAG TPA: S-methyl-5'-thioadenosine phosphorylase [Phycisphaerae bacterium]|nr:S-methyl-5'-thioadenosine phosphorylase [Phycisphaerae bacterium]